MILDSKLYYKMDSKRVIEWVVAGAIIAVAIAILVMVFCTHDEKYREREFGQRGISFEPYREREFGQRGIDSTTIGSQYQQMYG